ncbi:glycoside hydrolase family 61 protein [Moniliophthora roreri MCA 2997]|uniref:lytic cellulose monooxygenase (C4-dehydrogenating) n=1 Tax=Moniliophthora roreri (strain MCA 2997) TaxID=1381753 RepID=V2WI14_MONRO|nr:glycoside hydrolase family 61 protein [Moniliophthora roreri MCA 2997]
MSTILNGFRSTTTLLHAGDKIREPGCQTFTENISDKMKFAASLVSFCLLLQTASVHYIWTTLIAGNTQSTAANVSSKDMTCNVNPRSATDTVTVAPGSITGFILDNALYHTGPATIYLGKAPSTAASWDGSGASWFKGTSLSGGAKLDAFEFVSFNANRLTTTVSSNVPTDEYLVRIERIGLHVVGAPQYYIHKSKSQAEEVLIPPKYRFRNMFLPPTPVSR